MKKTYSRKGAGDDTTKAQPSFLTWSNQGGRTKKKLVKRVQRDRTASPLPQSTSSCLTPDKSLRVNRPKDAFDLLLAKSPINHSSLRSNKSYLFNQLISKSISSGKRKNNLNKNPNYDRTSDDESTEKSHVSVGAAKEDYMNGCNTHAFTDGTVHNSLTKYNLQVENIAKDKNILSESLFSRITKQANNLNSKKKSDSYKLEETINKSALTPMKRPLPVTSTPLFRKHGKHSLHNFSPISKDATELPKLSLSHSNEILEKNSICLKDYSNCSAVNSCEVSIYNAVVPETDKVVCNNENVEREKSTILINDSVEAQPFLGFTAIDPSLKCLHNSINISKNLFKSTYDDKKSTCGDNNKEYKVTHDLINAENDLSRIESLKKSSIGANNNNESTGSYNTCNSANNNQFDTQESDLIKEIGIPHIQIKRLRSSIFQEYYKNINNFNSSSSTCKDESSFNVHAPSDSTEKLRSSLNNGNNSCYTFENDCSAGIQEIFDDCNKIEDDNEVTCYSFKSDSHNLVYENGNSFQLPSISYSSNTTTSSNVAAESDSHASEECESSICSSNISTNKPKKCIIRESIDISSDSDSVVTDAQKHDKNSSLSCSIDSLSDFNHHKHESDHRMSSFVTTRRRNEVMDESLMFIVNSSRETILANHTEISDKSNNSDVSSAENMSVISFREIEPKTDFKPTAMPGIASGDVNKISETVTPIIMISSPKDKLFRPSIVWKTGKKLERSLSIYRRQTMLHEHTIHEETIQEEDCFPAVRSDTHGILNFNDSVYGQRDSILCKPRVSTIRIVKEPDVSRSNYSVSAVVEDEIGFLSEDCDDTLVELSRLSISDTGLDVTVLEREKPRDTAVDRAAAARDVVLRRCNQTCVLPFDECYPDTVLKNCTKIGEGVYGEVFLFRGRDGRGRIMKIVPVEGDTRINGEHQKCFQEVISEIVIAMELSALRAPIDDINSHCDADGDIHELDLASIENATDTFNEVLGVRCVYGTYPARLLDLWCLYDEAKESENDNPEILPPDQQYIVLELANAGKDLECYEFNNAEQAHALFHQVAYALAVGEEAYQFEHRDLHWGNVLITPTDQKFAHYVLRGQLHTVPRSGVCATIIDYTLSRLSLPLGGGERATLYNDLAADEGLFEANGDYQFDVYRHMKTKTGNEWKRFEPYTNILWLHYTVDKMITALRYKRTNTKIHKHYINKLKGIKNRILHCSSAVDFVLTCSEY